jgi:signal peptidase I
MKKLINWWNSWTGTFVVVFFVIFFIAQAFMIPSSSMVNTMLIGDGLFGKKFSYGMPIPRIPYAEIPILPDFNGNGHLWSGEGPKRGDIVIFRYPLNEKIHYVKRCVAKGGDLVMVRDKQLYIKPKEGKEYTLKNFKDTITIGDDVWVVNPYLAKHPGIHHDIRIVDSGVYPQQIFNFGPIEVPENEYFMMGDNRDHSNDSRYWGSVDYRYIVGTPWFIYISIDDDYSIRWNRMFRTVESIEADEIKAMEGLK